MPQIKLLVVYKNNRYTGITLSGVIVKKAINTILDSHDIILEDEPLYLVNNKPADINQSFDDLKISQSCSIKIIDKAVGVEATHVHGSFSTAQSPSNPDEQILDEELTPTVSELTAYYKEIQARAAKRGHLYSKFTEEEERKARMKRMPFIKVKVIMNDGRTAVTEMATESTVRQLYAYCENLTNQPFSLLNSVPGGEEILCSDQTLNSLGFIHSITVRLIEE